MWSFTVLDPKKDRIDHPFALRFYSSTDRFLVRSERDRVPVLRLDPDDDDDDDEQTDCLLFVRYNKF